MSDLGFPEPSPAFEPWGRGRAWSYRHAAGDQPTSWLQDVTQRFVAYRPGPHIRWLPVLHIDPQPSVVADDSVVDMLLFREPSQLPRWVSLGSMDVSTGGVALTGWLVY